MGPFAYVLILEGLRIHSCPDSLSWRLAGAPGSKRESALGQFSLMFKLGTERSVGGSEMGGLRDGFVGCLTLRTD